MRRSYAFRTPLVGVNYLTAEHLQVVAPGPFMSSKRPANANFLGEDGMLVEDARKWPPSWVWDQPRIADPNPRIQRRLDAVHSLYKVARAMPSKPGTWRRRAFKLCVKLADQGVLV